MNSGTVLDFSMSKSSAPTATPQPTPTPPPRQLSTHGLPFTQLESLSIGNLSLAALSSLLVKAAVSAATATTQQPTSVVGQPQSVPQPSPTFAAKDCRFSFSNAAESTAFASSLSSAFEPIMSRVSMPIYSNGGATMDSALTALLQQTLPSANSPPAAMKQQSAFAALTAAALASSRGAEPPSRPTDNLLPKILQSHEHQKMASSALTQQAARLGLKLLDEEDEENIAGFTSSTGVSSPLVRKPNSKRLRLDSANGFSQPQPQQQPLSLASPPPTPTRSSVASTASCVSSTQNSPVSASALRRQQHHSSSANSTASTGAGTRSTPQRRPAAPIPDSLKDEAYYERRKKNNDAAKRSRDSRRQKEEETAQRACFLEQENVQLRTQVSLLKTEIAKLHSLILSNGGTLSGNNSNNIENDNHVAAIVPQHHHNGNHPTLLSALSGKGGAFERQKRSSHCRELFPPTDDDGVEKTRQSDACDGKTKMCADAKVASLSSPEDCDKNFDKLGDDVGSS